MSVPSKQGKKQDSLGPFCDVFGITKSQLKSGNVKLNNPVNNGAVCEIVKFWKQQRADDSVLDKYLIAINLTVDEIVKKSIFYIAAKRDDLRRKKDRDAIDALDNNVFSIIEDLDLSSVSQNEEIPLIRETEAVLSQNHVLPNDTNVPNVHAPLSHENKSCNTLQYELVKKERALKSIQNEINNAEQKKNDVVSHINTFTGRYSPHNVRRRDCRASKNFRLLMESRRTIQRLECEINNLKKEKVREEEEPECSSRKRKLQKSLSYHKKKRRMSCGDCVKLQNKIDVLESELSKLNSERNEVNTMKFIEDRKVPDHIRMAILELVSLDIATNKVCDAIEVVGRNIFSTNFEDKLSRQTVQGVVDAGQAIAKTFIAEKVSQATTLGIAKDGTTKQNQKVLGSNIIIDNKEQFCLGFSSVPSETGDAIKQDLEEKLDELVSLSSDENFKLNVLEKLSFLMSDRAANEKKSNRLIKEWCSVVLTAHNKQPQDIKEIFCMAHVLLAFHSYVLKALKEADFNFGLDFSGYKNPIEKFLKYASDVFGPVGDHRGVRDVWVEDCRQRNVKPTITNYKDNRFNGLFAVAGQVFHHREDMIRILQNHKNHNFRQTSVQSCLENEEFCLLLKCLGIFCNKITVPYWNLVISGHFSYSQLGPVVKELHSVLVKWRDDPQSIFTSDVSCFQFPPSTSPEPEMCDLFKSIVTVVCKGFINALDAQVKDLLDEENPVPQTSDGLATNLGCERMFGMLDASKHRRPKATLHHHTTVIHLKQTRASGISCWYKNLSDKARRHLWSKAYKRGRELRQQHKESDLATLRERHKLSQEQKSKKGNTVNLPCLPSPDEIIKKDEWIAVAYPDSWYTGLVLDDSPPGALVRADFGEAAKVTGRFKYPARRDVQNIQRAFILKTKLSVTPAANLRYWTTDDADAITAVYKDYTNVFGLKD